MEMGFRGIMGLTLNFWTMFRGMQMYSLAEIHLSGVVLYLASASYRYHHM